MPVQVRDATPADAAAVAELLGELGYPTTATEVASRLRRFGADPASRVLLAEVDGDIAGLVATHLVPRLEEDRPSSRIVAIVTAAAHRRAGIGTALTEAAAAEAREL